jgi:prenyltransferase beta subunit
MNSNKVTVDSGIWPAYLADLSASDKTAIAESVIHWLVTMKVSPTEYKMNETADATIFTSCFALFIMDMFRQTDKFTDEGKRQWISYIQSYQDENDGYFKPKESLHNDRERSWYQLTCFCLSALGILGSEPRFPLRFIERWETPDDVKKYLYEEGCHLGNGGSGNKAMFLAIFLTYEYERTGEKHFLDKMNAWFEFHDETQNTSGFWGTDRSSHFLHGLQNGLHQLLVYFYWGIKIKKLKSIVDVALSIQDKDGFFAPTPSGGGCWDYDAVHILANAYQLVDYKRSEITKTLLRAFYAILGNQNGGFCQSTRRLSGIVDLAKSFPFCFSGKVPYLWYYRLRKTAGVIARRQTEVFTGWTKKPIIWDASNLWDTWFRCLSLAEIANTIPLSDNLGLDKAKFHEMIGLGYFSNKQLEY